MRVTKQPSRGSRLVAGLISGTSMDGIDAAVVRISGPSTKPRVRLLAFETVPYSAAIRQRILGVATGEAVTAGDISQLNFLLGELFAQAVLRVCRRAGISPQRLAAIGSHGQTIYHQSSPTLEQGTRITSTLQIAEPSVIAERCRVPVVADFRPADMAAGGQGAPLVPMVDYLLLRDARKWTVALNVGGIANFTVIPAGAKPEQVYGFDTGPGNMIIDGLVRHVTKGKKAYDAGGRWASKGNVNESLLNRMLGLPYFSQKPPKSAGREQFGEAFLQKFFLAGVASRTSNRAPREELENRKSKIANASADLIRTATELTARTIAGALERFVPGKIAIHRLIVSGGGAHNKLLMARLSELLPDIRIHQSSEFGLDVDAKEAIAFAVLADRTIHGLPGNLPSVTGARRAVVLGKVSRP